ncbi:MAG: hypothetical protein LBI31_05785 [Zoogloeaceae bacterium]|jgi:hypothetical protein|nr:hypothetical protein [Zoogloeaceae bacterium]
MSTLDHFKTSFNSVGWFIPPYVTFGFQSHLSKLISAKEGTFSQRDLEAWLSIIYSPENLAAMVSERYTVTPYVNDYKIIIAEAVEAHFLGLNHIAVSCLMPVIEGAGKKLANSRNVPWTSITTVFENLANDCKADALNNNIGAVGEILSMMDSFIDFTKNHLYINSNNYTLQDNTNRHGILHGAFADADYGEPINFYKAIAAVDFLCFVSAFRASISWFAPSSTERSRKLSDYYKTCILCSSINPYSANNLFKPTPQSGAV